MGDVAVGTRSGQDGEGLPENPADAAAHARDAGLFPGNGSGDGSGNGSTASEGGMMLDEQSGAQQRDTRADVADRHNDESSTPRSFWKELPLLIVIALVLALLIKTFLVQAFSIPSDSMQNTLQRGDRVMVDKLTPWFGSEPERGEVVVFHDPADWLAGEPTPQPNALQRVLSWIGLMPSAEEKDLIKRVIAVGGDTVECKGTGPVRVNGHALVENSYVFPGNTPCSTDDQGGQFRVKVPEGFLWVMGDHRQNSRDSRYNQGDKNHGMVPVDQVVGRAIVKAWPINRWGTLPVPDTFDQQGIGNQAAASASTTPASASAVTALPGAPGVVSLALVVPPVLWRRRRRRGAASSTGTDGQN